MISSPYLPNIQISKVIFWISGSDFPPSQIAKEFVGCVNYRALKDAACDYGDIVSQLAG